MSRSPEDGYGRGLLAVATALAILIVLYSVFLGQLLLGVLVVVSVIVPLFALYLLYRIVLAHERIATALESRADAGRNDERR